MPGPSGLGVTWVKPWGAVCPQEPWARLSCCFSEAALAVARHGDPREPLQLALPKVVAPCNRDKMARGT